MLGVVSVGDGLNLLKVTLATDKKNKERVTVGKIIKRQKTWPMLPDFSVALTLKLWCMNWFTSITAGTKDMKTWMTREYWEANRIGAFRVGQSGCGMGMSDMVWKG